MLSALVPLLEAAIKRVQANWWAGGEYLWSEDDPHPAACMLSSCGQIAHREGKFLVEELNKDLPKKYYNPITPGSNLIRFNDAQKNKAAVIKQMRVTLKRLKEELK